MRILCFRSTTSTLTMENVPWHEDVKNFAEAIASKSNGKYELACEHAHSCCVLLANAEKFKLNGSWYTWIDYEKFHDLVLSLSVFMRHCSFINICIKSITINHTENLTFLLMSPYAQVHCLIW